MDASGGGGAWRKSGWFRSRSASCRIPSSMIAGNIGPAEQRKRLIFGVLTLAAGCGWVVTGRARSVAGALILFALFWFGVLGLFQAKEKT
jgi:hypothetical protein